jgi:hypothetical protein
VASFAWPFDQGVEGTGKPEDNGGLSLWGSNPNLPQEEWDALRQWLSIVGPAVGFVFHHSKFDLHLMDAGVRRWPGLGIDLSPWTIWDTQNVAHLLWPEAKTTSLKPTAKRLWGVAETGESEKVKEYLRKAKLPGRFRPVDAPGRIGQLKRAPGHGPRRANQEGAGRLRRRAHDRPRGFDQTRRFRSS